MKADFSLYKISGTSHKIAVTREQHNNKENNDIQISNAGGFLPFTYIHLPVSHKERIYTKRLVK